MASITTIIIPCLIALTAFIFLLALVYIIPALLVRRFHNLNIVFTMNVCLAIAFCNLYWFTHYIILYFFPNLNTNPAFCLAQSYFSTMCNMQVPFTVLTVSIHRLCCVLYYAKPFFKKKKWAIICISCQWIAGILFALPALSTCQLPVWFKIYTFLIVVIIPSFICFTIYIIIFKRLRLSTHRVQDSSVGTNNNQNQSLSRRNIHLLRHMIVMFSIFVGGWSPIYIYRLVVVPNYSSITVYIFIILASLSFLLDIINLFSYNHQLRQYVLQKIFQ